MRLFHFSELENITQSWGLVLNIAPCVVDHGLHIWPNFTRDRAERWFREAEIRLPKESSDVAKESPHHEDEDEDEDEEEYGCDPTIIQEAQIQWLHDVVAIGRNPETQR